MENKQQTDKEKQKKLLSEIMEADEKDGLYEPVTNIHTLTAVEWLHNQWANEREWSWEKIESWFKQAKQMEKEQIINAWDNGYLDYTILMHEDAEQYYNETYNK